MPLSTALRRCPDAVFLPADRAAYDDASAEVWGVVRTVVDLVEVWGWDEGFVGADVDDPELLAHALRDAVQARTSFTCCVGIGDNKIRAKVATGFAKAAEGSLPEDAAGVYRLTRDNWSDVMGARPTLALWGVGTKTAEKLAAMGISTVDGLASADVEELQARFGPTTGPWLQSLGRGEGSATVNTEPYIPRGHGREETLREDLVERADVEATLRRLAAEVLDDVGSERLVTHVAIKVRFAPFFTTTRIHKLPTPTLDVATVQAAAVTLLDRLEQGRPVRLLGVRVSLQPPAESGSRSVSR